MAQLVKVTCRAGCRGLVFRIAATWVRRGPLACPVCRGPAEAEEGPPRATSADKASPAPPKRSRPGRQLSDEERAEIRRSVDEYVERNIADINRETAKLNAKATAKRKLPKPPDRAWTPPALKRVVNLPSVPRSTP